MRKLISSVIGYIFLRYLVFLGSVYAINDDAKMVQWSDLQRGEDWVYFLWLFGIPLVIDVILIGLPMIYGLNKITDSSNKLIFYSLFTILFVIEFVIANWIYGTQLSLIKIGVSLILFLILFGKKIF